MNSTVAGQSVPNALICLLGLPGEHLSLYSCSLSSCSTPPVLVFLPHPISLGNWLKLLPLSS